MSGLKKVLALQMKACGKAVLPPQGDALAQDARHLGQDKFVNQSGLQKALHSGTAVDVQALPTMLAQGLNQWMRIAA